MLPADLAVKSVGTIFKDIDLDQDVAQQLLTILKNGMDDLEGNQLPGVPPGNFGAGATGQSLGHHTELAHETVVTALLEMVQTLGHSAESVTTYMDTQEYNDYSARIAFANQLERANIMGKPIFPEKFTDSVRQGSGGDF